MKNGLKKGTIARLKKGIALALALLLVVGMLAACGQKADTATTDTAADSATTETPKAVSIGAVQLVEHPALDSAYEGFIEGMAEAGYVEGQNLTIDFQNAQGDANNLSTIADSFVSQNKDLIFSITTDATQAMASKTTEIPIIATAVTDYEGAKLVDSNEAPGGNVTGTSDMNPVSEQIALALELVPTAETVGFIYNSSEDNSVIQVDMAKAAVEAAGKKWTEVTVTGTNDVQQAATSLVKKCDVIYIPTDNTLASSMPIVGEVTNKAKIAVVCGESNMVNEGGLATLGIDYKSLGKQTAAMAVKVIEGADPATLPIEFATTGNTVTINKETVEAIGITIPEKYADSVVMPEEAE
ncbi:MAG: ABC transporter substrate-binding protein [Actinomycetes bacterium]|nr:ABC transporter substrate-binding protein [Actinomycetes bacterium]